MAGGSGRVDGPARVFVGWRVCGRGEGGCWALPSSVSMSRSTRRRRSVAKTNAMKAVSNLPSLVERNDPATVDFHYYITTRGLSEFKSILTAVSSIVSVGSINPGSALCNS